MESVLTTLNQPPPGTSRHPPHKGEG
jgi:hypothetical protein